MSQSSDDGWENQRPDPRQDPRQTRPAHPQRTPAVKPFGPRADVAPPPPRARPLDWDDSNYDPGTAPPARRIHPPADPNAGFALEFEPSPLRAARPPQRPADHNQDRQSARDIEPPLDEAQLEDAWRQVMTGQPPGQSLRQPPAEPAREAARADVRQSDPRQPSPRQAQELRPPSYADEELEAPTRNDGKVERGKGLTPIVQAGTVTGKSLTLVIAIMSFFACLTAGAVYMIDQSAKAWLRDIATEVTVQVEARDKGSIDRTVAAVSQFLQRQPGVRTVKPLSEAENAQLLEPWLGAGSDLLKDLPVPRLIAIEIDRNNPPKFDVLGAALSREFKGVSLDDHRRWQHQIRAVTGSFSLGGLAILVLVCAATTAVIVSATRSALAANRQIVEVLHFVGATDKFIAREFAGHFLNLGIRAGVVGAGAAMLVFFLVPFVMEAIGGGAVTSTELRRLVGNGTLDLAGYLILLLVVVVIAALCMFTSRLGVYRILNSQHL